MDNEGFMDLIEWLERADDQYPSLTNGSDLVCASLEAVDPFSAIFEDGIAPIRVSYYVDRTGVGVKAGSDFFWQSRERVN